MLPLVDALFTLVRQLAARSHVTEIAVPKWLVQRHGLGAMSARAGVASYRDDLVRATIAWAKTEQDLPPIVEALTARGVQVAPIKGVAHARWLYGAPADRPMADIDLLVRPDQADRARGVLREVGLERARAAVLHHAEPWVRDELVIDLHWNIIAPGRSHIDLDAIWSRMTAGWPDGAVHLDPSDAMVFHLVHLTRNRLRLPLVNVVDFSRLGERADMSVVQSRARSWGLATAVELGHRFFTAILDGRHDRPAGWVGPSGDEIALLDEGSGARKIAFDVAVAGSVGQLGSRVVHFCANQLARLRRSAAQ